MFKPPLLRFAPSPTGSLHLGGLRTALLNHLYVKKHGGKWILRIEDTDQSRLVQGSIDDIRRSLEWAGLHYDYGPGAGGQHKPYLQSERLDLYHHYVNKLLEQGHAYHCFCTHSRLRHVREKLAKSGSNATYDKACLHLSEEEAKRRLKAGETFMVRLNDDKIPPRPTPADLIFGAVRDAHNCLPTDPVLLKSDKFPTYHLASVVDDHEMGITHVFRGEEWLPSLPLHLDLYACLGVAPPEFAHLPLLLNADGSKMSKRHGDVSVADYIAKGWSAPGVLNWLALAGWGAGSATPGGAEKASEQRRAPESTSVLTLNELVEKFDLSALTSRRTILDPKKLEFLNKGHLQREIESDIELPGLAKKARNLVEAKYPESLSLIADLDFQVVLRLVKDRIKNIEELPPLLGMLFHSANPSSAETKAVLGQLKLAPGRYLEVVTKYDNAINGAITRDEPWDEGTLRRIEALRMNRDEMAILRVALTGKKTGLPLLTTMILLGPRDTQHRIARARLWAEQQATNDGERS